MTSAPRRTAVETRRSHDDIETAMGSAVIITGTHYSMTSLVGALVAEAPGVRLVHEPFNPEPTLGYTGVGTAGWYEHVDEGDIRDVALRLVRIAQGRMPLADLRHRVGAIRSGRDLLRVGRVVRDHAARRLAPGRPVFKDPFMVFASRQLQSTFGTRIVLCVRHPCAFAESVIRRSDGFDLEVLASQPGLLDDLGAEAETVERAASQDLSPLESAAILWRVVYSFAAQQLLGNERTLVVRQEDFVADPARLVEELYGFLQLALPRSSSDLSTTYTTHQRRRSVRRSYVHRDARRAAEKWRGRLSEAEQQTVMDAVGSVAAMFGYGR